MKIDGAHISCSVKYRNEGNESWVVRLEGSLPFITIHYGYGPVKSKLYASLILSSYADKRIYLRILGWTIIYAFSSTDENETSVMYRLILSVLSNIKWEWDNCTVQIDSMGIIQINN